MSASTRDRLFDIAVMVILVAILLGCVVAAVFMLEGIRAFSDLPPR